MHQVFVDAAIWLLAWIRAERKKDSLQYISDAKRLNESATQPRFRRSKCSHFSLTVAITTVSRRQFVVTFKKSRGKKVVKQQKRGLERRGATKYCNFTYKTGRDSDSQLVFILW